jgi:hypothetical protein|tara:strand:+ start:5191 stop:5877 length:687 start_codon:yes stop_codon:yes gene_type:complete
MTEDVIIKQDEAETVAAVEQAETPEPTVTQSQMERVLEERLARQRRALLKKYEGVDLEKYNSLVEAEEHTKQEEALARKEFDTVLKSTVEKKDSAISRLTSELHSVKVEGTLINSASNRRAIKPEQISALLKDQIKLNGSGEVEITDPTNGNVRYTDSGDPMTVDNLVEEFLSTNPHYLTANSAGGGSVSNSRPDQNGQIDITKLDLNNPDDKELYAKYRVTSGLASR